jgi:hypothetical protein
MDAIGVEVRESRAPVGQRGRGAPPRSPAQRMANAKQHAGDTNPDVVALAASVQELTVRTFGARPWTSLARHLGPGDRAVLGGRNDRRLTQYLSAEFGPKARRGPRASTIFIVWRHCLPAADERECEQRFAELELLYAKVNPGRCLRTEFDRLSAEVSAQLPGALVPSPRPAGPGEQRTGQDLDPQAAEATHLRGENAALRAELKAAAARIQALEAQLSAGLKRRLPELNLAEPATQNALVRPYTRAHESRTTAKPAADRGEANGPPTAADDDPTLRGPGPKFPRQAPPPAPMSRPANTPRAFSPLRPIRAYPPDLIPLSAPIFAPPVRRPRVIGRATVPDGLKIAPPPRTPTGAEIWGCSTATIPPWTHRTHPVGADAAEVDSPRRRRQVRAQARRLSRQNAWDQWADLPVQQLPPETAGFAQLPLLAAALALAAAPVAAVLALAA